MLAQQHVQKCFMAVVGAQVAILGWTQRSTQRSHSPLLSDNHLVGEQCVELWIQMSTRVPRVPRAGLVESTN